MLNEPQRNRKTSWCVLIEIGGGTLECFWIRKKRSEFRYMHFLMIAFYNISFFLFQHKICPVFVLWALLRKYVIGNKSPILRGLLPRLIVPNGNKWNSCPLLMICCQPISSMVIAHSKENGSVHRNIIVWRFSTHIWGRRFFSPNKQSYGGDCFVCANS